MGYELSNEVLDNAPSDLTPAERLVLSVLAGYVRDESTRECWPGLEKLVKRTGLKPDSLRRVFQRLAARGLDPRVAIGVDKNGKKVFAHESQRTTYRIPKFESRDESPATEEGSASRHSKPRGGTVVPQRRDAGPSEAGSASRSKEVKEEKEEPASRTSGAQGDQEPVETRPAAKEPTAHQVADELTKAFWNVHGKTRSQPYVSVLKIVRAAIGNGVPRDDLARALDQVARTGSIASWKLDNALADLHTSRGGARTITQTTEPSKTGLNL